MTELTEAQEIFKECVEAHVERFNALEEAVFGEGKPETAESLGLMFTFHEPDQVSVDGNLFDILNYGQADFGFGRELYDELNERLESAGILMENENGCDWRFYRD
jgi:hypothetical protein